VFTTIPNAVKNVSYTATYNKKVYTVSFVDDNDAIIGTAQTVDYGNSATAPTAPSKPGYTFIGWTPEQLFIRLCRLKRAAILQ
jgi:hypothetical protein